MPQDRICTVDGCVGRKTAKETYADLSDRVYVVHVEVYEDARRRRSPRKLHYWSAQPLIAGTRVLVPYGARELEGVVLNEASTELPRRAYLRRVIQALPARPHLEDLAAEVLEASRRGVEDFNVALATYTRRVIEEEK